MSKICQLTGVKPLSGNNVSHSKRRTRRVFNPTLQNKRVYVKEIDAWVKLRLSTRALRNMEKLGTYKYLKLQLAAGFNPKVWVEYPNKKVAASKLKRGYRRVEHVDANGHKTYSITYEPEVSNNKKVSLSSLLK